MSIIPKNFKFIDLFSGIGGFHFAMKKLSPESKCILASEIDKNAIKLYGINFNQFSGINIKDIIYENLDDFDILCAGFPCQPFSKAGFQNGFNDERGNLFFEIKRIIELKARSSIKPKILVLENVRNLASHDDGRTWAIIHEVLINLGYNTLENPLILSPKDFGVPQLRERAIILAVDNNIYNGKLDFKVKKLENTKVVYNILDQNDDNLIKEFMISKYEEKVLDAWDYFIKNLDLKVIGFPIWSDEFYADYSIEDLPKWKQNFIVKNRKLYLSNKTMIDKWYKKFEVRDFKKTHRKFEWQAGNSINSVYEGIIQFRPSGVRVKKPDYAPTLVAMAHVPIIGKYKRYMTPLETARLQSLPPEFNFDSVGYDIYRLLGNAVNVDVIYHTTKQFIEYIDENIATLQKC